MPMETRDGGSAPLPCSYAPLPEDAEAAATVGRARRTEGPLCAALLLATAAVLLVVAALAGQLPTGGIVVMSGHQTTVDAAPISTSSRGPESGVSEKTSGAITIDTHGERLGADAGSNAFPWSNAMLQWQRTGFHFQPEKNWMNDPNGPVYYKGWYHLFYQYNPDGAIWGNKIAWGHAASRDLLRWRHLPVAMSPDQWYDINGVWSGSATVLPDGRIVMLYTGSTNASVQSIPRTVVLDTKTGSNLLQWPVEETGTLRTNSTNLGGITVDHGSVFPFSLHRATQLDIEASFRIDPLDIAAAKEADVGYNCSTSSGAAGRGTLGPFGLLVLADARRHGDDTERTAVYFYVARGLDGGLRTHFCHDETHSSRANDIVKRVVGNIVPVLDGEEFSVRVLVDHSIVESFAMGGRLTATSRVYPTEAIYANAGVYLFNNATSARVTATSLVVHEMDSSYNQAYIASL